MRIVLLGNEGVQSRLAQRTALKHQLQMIHPRVVSHSTTWRQRIKHSHMAALQDGAIRIIDCAADPWRFSGLHAQ
ncbi:hypothetical protein GCM10007898_33210 [Dyella flagellata]|uniref:Uncharacterized protein n=1 Tax=Dyella flagellata TaxID=1867833 RepID=A0ABQ5XEU7_9GAMM|nr:hypothetical protein GCM10007898_33210 [Dyella flagellata]